MRGFKMSYKAPISPLPPMGWNSYCTVNCDPSEKLLLDAADALCDLGLRDAGYVYVNLDDGWLEKERNAKGEIVSRDAIFPHGMKYVTDYIHSKGLKAGTYLGCGFTTWNGDAGSLGHEYEDARKIAEWGFDYLKYDRHPVESDPPRDTMSEYLKMGMAIRDCGRDIVYNLCEHGTTKPWLWASVCGSLWRIGKDVRDCFSSENTGCLGILDIIDRFIAEAAPYSHLGGFNDPDMLVVGMHEQNDWKGPGMTDIEYRTNFAIWCVVAAPLLIGADPNHLDSVALDILKNPRLIAINQDPLAMPAHRVSTEDHGRELWVRQLSDFRWVSAIINRAHEKREYSYKWEELDLSPAVPMKITDAWTGEVLTEKVCGEFAVSLEAHDTAVLVMTPVL